MFEHSAWVCEEPHNMHWSMKAQQECVGARAGKDTVGILYKNIMAMYPGVLKIHTPIC